MHPSAGKSLVVFGAGGAVGRAVTAGAVRRGHRVLAVERHWPRAAPEAGPAERRQADVLRDDLAPLVAGSDAVLSCIGLPLSPRTTLDPPPLYTEGTLRILRAMRAGRVRRLVVISASFVATLQRGPVWFRAAAGLGLAQVFRQMADMERILRATEDIEWTAVRPGWLYDAPATGDATVRADTIPETMVRTRIPDLAEFMLDCAESDRFLRQTPAIARAEPPWATSPFEVLRDVLP